MVQSVVEYTKYLEKHYSDRVAFRWITEENQIFEKKYTDYIADIKNFSNYLRASVPNCEGKHIGIFANNSYRYAVCFWGILLSKAVAVPLSIRESFDVLKYECEASEVTLIFSDGIENVLFSGKTLPCEIRSLYSCEYPCNVPTLSDADNLATALLIFTSGTTGKNKCVALSQKNLFSSMSYLEDLVDTVESGIPGGAKSVLHTMPFYHIAGILTMVGWTLYGRTLNLCLNLANIVPDNAALPSDYTLVPPIVLQLWMKAIKLGRKEVLGNLKSIISGGAAADPALFQAYLDIGIQITQVYSMTESSAAGLFNPIFLTQKPNSLGKAGKGVSVKLIDGEICLQTPAIMQCYYNDPAETAQALQDNWLHTGDMGYMDENGYIYLTGRKKNLIILASGENVSPVELEGLVSKNTDVKEIVVKEKNGKICAEVFCETDKQEKIRSFITEVNRSLAMYKRMTLVEFRNEPFPRTASGKIKRT